MTADPPARGHARALGQDRPSGDDEGPGRLRHLWRTLLKRARGHARAPWRTLPKRPSNAEKDPDLAWKELSDQFYWYDRAANRNRDFFLLLKVPTLLLGGAVTILAASNSSAVLTASLAAAIVAAEGIQQLFKLQPVWLDYRGTADALRRLALSY